MSRYRDDLEFLITRRPVRKRQPAMYVDSSFQKPAKSDRKMNLPTKSHGSCLLPPDFDFSLSRSPGAARKSWKTVLDGTKRPPTKRGRRRPKKNKQEYSRQKRTVAEDEVKWTIQKKLLLDGPTTKKRKSVPHSKFPGNRKLKSAPKSTTFISRDSKLRTRSTCCRCLRRRRRMRCLARLRQPVPVRRRRRRR